MEGRKEGGKGRRKKPLVGKRWRKGGMEFRVRRKKGKRKN